MSIDEFLKQLFLVKTYSWELVILYICAGILAGMTRLIIRDNSKMELRKWWNDGSLLGAIIISVTGAVLFDNSFLWAFLGGYFIVYVLEGIQKLIEKGRGGGNS
jgi:hypothetical protein